MRRNMSGNLGLYEYLCPGSVYTVELAYNVPVRESKKGTY